jgi:lipoprotein-anchoring transpeptidase ErfK/SrfK
MPHRWQAPPPQRVKQSPQPIRARQGNRKPPPNPAPQPQANGLPQPPGLSRTASDKPRLRPRPRTKIKLRWWMIVIATFALFMVSLCGMVTVGVGVIYARGILPGISVAGIALGGLSQDEAAAKLSDQWHMLILQDGEREWSVNPVEVGIYLDAANTAEAAYQQGRGAGQILQSLIGSLSIAPIINVDLDTAQTKLMELAPEFEVLPINAGVQLVNGQVETTPPVDGRMLDWASTITRMQNEPESLTDGTLDLVMFAVQPEVTDASPMVAEAQKLLSSSLDIRLYDPKTGDIIYWSLPAAQWATWLSAIPDSSSATGLTLHILAEPVRNYLTAQATNSFDSSRYIDEAAGVLAVQDAITAGHTNPALRVYHRDTEHVVQSGETIVSIAWDYGVPYPWIQAANPGVEYLSAGQTITIPSVDNFLPYEPVPEKRIVISISQQHAWVYENGAVKWDWLASTGITSSPTWPGVYQIQSHEINAYAGNWNLWMPNFMGVYQPIPGSDFTNGFHGFPTRGGGQLLWENNLGTRVTYGCILLSNTNAELLYNWAENGVVVEIQP